MAVAGGVGGEEVADTAHGPLLAVGIQPQGHGHLIGLLKADTLHLVAEAVGILLGHIHRS